MEAIWLIGGTQESAALAAALAAANIPYVVTVTTEAARSLYPAYPNLSLRVGHLSSETLPGFLKQYSVCGIVDASHPFAIEISQLAIAAATARSLPYLRFERSTASSQLPHPAITQVRTLTQVLCADWLTEQRVLLTIGYRWLPLFQAWQSQAILFARILPSAVALETALAAGFTPDRLIALRPPVSLALERALWQHWQISTVVTKASGAAGGEDIKQQLAIELGVQLIVIARPEIAYPQKTSHIPVAIAFCRRLAGTSSP